MCIRDRSTICATRRDGGSNSEMSILFLRIADNPLSSNGHQFQLIVQQHARSRAALSVHKLHMGVGQISQALDSLWVPTLYHQALIAAYERHYFHRNVCLLYTSDAADE